MRDRVGIKMQAKDIMRGARTSPYLVTLILLAITFRSEERRVGKEC